MKHLRSTTGLLFSATLALCGLAASSLSGAVEATSRAGRALLDAASMEPVEVTLAARTLALTSEDTNGPVPPAPAHNSVTFRVPAAYLAGIDRDRHGPGASMLVFRLWSRSLDPVRPDEVADAAACGPGELQPCAALGPSGGRVAARRRGGEHPLRITLTDGASSEAHRRYNIRLRVGLARGAGSGILEPCDIREDPALGMLVGRAPEGVNPFGACRFGTTVAVHRDGRRFPPASFMKSGPDGEPKFGVRCREFVAAGDGAPPGGCELVGFFGVWPLFFSVPSDRAAEWDETFERVRAFLARHAVARTDRNSQGERGMP